MSHHFCAPDLGAGNSLRVFAAHSMAHPVLHCRLEKTLHLCLNLDTSFARTEERLDSAGDTSEHFLSLLLRFEDFADRRNLAIPLLPFLFKCLQATLGQEVVLRSAIVLGNSPLGLYSAPTFHAAQ